MKTQTSLYIREDGRILIGEWPVEPESDIQDSIALNGMYQAALKEAIEKAVECADQEKAMGLIKVTAKELEYGMVDKGLYPIPGIRYEVRDFEIVFSKPGDKFPIPGTKRPSRKLAYITEPPPLAKELQPEAWNKSELVKNQEGQKLIRFHTWMSDMCWELHSSGEYYYRLEYIDQWPPKETCTEKELLQKYYSRKLEEVKKV